MRSAPVAFVFALSTLVACTFPDVDYAGAGGTASTTSSSGTGGGADGGTGGNASVCPGLDPCSAAAGTCAGVAASQYTACLQQCHGSGCNKCGTDRTTAETLCAAKCESCAPAGCAGAAATCQKAAGL